MRQEDLRQYYPHQEPPPDPQCYKRAYGDIQRFMRKNGFEHRQYSVYTSVERLTTLDVITLMERLAEQFPWLSKCVEEIDVTNIGVQHSLRNVLDDASKNMDIELDEPALVPDVTPAEPNSGKADHARRKDRKDLER